MEKIELVDVTLKEALIEVELLDRVSYKDINSICLLTEEMYSLFNELLNEKKGDFTLDRKDDEIYISLGVQTWVNDETKEKFISMNSSGKNDAYTGVKGFFRSVMDSLMLGIAATSYGAINDNDTYMEYPGDNCDVYKWNVKEYTNTNRHTNSNWEELEKSIIMKFADDVSISVRNSYVLMTITKNV